MLTVAHRNDANKRCIAQNKVGHRVGCAKRLEFFNFLCKCKCQFGDLYLAVSFNGDAKHIIGQMLMGILIDLLAEGINIAATNGKTRRKLVTAKACQVLFAVGKRLHKVQALNASA